MFGAPALVRHPLGITTVDAEYVRPGYASVHLIERGGRAAVVDTGTNTSVPLVLAALAELGIEPDAVEFVFVTHAHLDHAGGAGLLLSKLPRARVILHPRAAPHLLDPTRLVEATRQVYGAERSDALYGTLLPIPTERSVISADLDRLQLGGSEFRILHTPGHALHHHVLHDLDAASIFTGDTFGLSYRWFDTAAGPYIFPTTTPSQFDPEQLTASIERLLTLQPEALYLTHFGRVSGVAALGASLLGQVAELSALARQHQHAPDPHAAIYAGMRAQWLGGLARHGCRLDVAELDTLLSSDLELNTQGLLSWLARAKRTPR
jgi:glyoxylase-like metal-dependent hydrolase (beta-lactamase superfamily II)